MGQLLSQSVGHFIVVIVLLLEGLEGLEKSCYCKRNKIGVQLVTMISSLTGFGRASITDETGRVSVELKSVNNRFLQIDTRLPYGYNWADGLLRQYVSNTISRGKVYLNLEIVDYNPNQDVIINKPLLNKLIALGDEISTQTGKNLPMALDGLLSLPGVMKVDSQESDNDELWKRIEPVLVEAVKSFVEARKREGENLANDIKSHADVMRTTIAKIEELLPEFRANFTTKFTERIKELAGQAGFDETRLGMEIALWVDRSDVSEEIARLYSHLKELDNILASDKPVGRRLDFLVQDRITALTTENQALKGQISQSEQNAYLISQLRPVANPAYIVANPYTGYYGYNSFYGAAGNIVA